MFVLFPSGTCGVKISTHCARSQEITQQKEGTPATASASSGQGTGQPQSAKIVHFIVVVCRNASAWNET